MYIQEKDRLPDYDMVVAVLFNALRMAVAQRERSNIAYVLLRASILAWKNMGGGYNDISDIRSIYADVYDELTHEMLKCIHKKKEKNGGVEHPLILPKREKKPTIYDKDGKPIEGSK